MHFVCNVKPTWPKPRACHFDSCKAQVETLPEKHVRLPGPLQHQSPPQSERGIVKAQVSSLTPFQPQQSTTV